MKDSGNHDEISICAIRFSETALFAPGRNPGIWISPYNKIMIMKMVFIVFYNFSGTAPAVISPVSVLNTIVRVLSIAVPVRFCYSKNRTFDEQAEKFDAD